MIFQWPIFRRLVDCFVVQPFFIRFYRSCLTIFKKVDAEFVNRSWNSIVPVQHLLFLPRHYFSVEKKNYFFFTCVCLHRVYIFLFPLVFLRSLGSHSKRPLKTWNQSLTLTLKRFSDEKKRKKKKKKKSPPPPKKKTLFFFCSSKRGSSKHRNTRRRRTASPSLRSSSFFFFLFWPFKWRRSSVSLCHKSATLSQLSSRRTESFAVKQKKNVPRIN